MKSLNRQSFNRINFNLTQNFQSASTVYVNFTKGTQFVSTWKRSLAHNWNYEKFSFTDKTIMLKFKDIEKLLHKIIINVGVVLLSNMGMFLVKATRLVTSQGILFAKNWDNLLTLSPKPSSNCKKLSCENLHPSMFMHTRDKSQHMTFQYMSVA